MQRQASTRKPDESDDDDRGYDIGLDFWGPLEESVNGHKYLLGGIERRTGFGAVEGLPDKSAATTLGGLKEIVRRVRVAAGPEAKLVVRIHSDKDKSLMGVVEDYIRDWQQTWTEGYNHNQNARQERRWKKLQQMFRAMLLTATGGRGTYKKLWCEGMQHAIGGE